MNPFIILLMVIVSTYNKSYLVETEDDKKSDPNIGAANDTNDYGQDYDVEIIPDIKLPPLPPKPQGNPEINPPGTQAQPGSNSPCSGNLEFGWAYPSKATMNNDLNLGATDKKNSPQECQAHCKTFPRCVGFTWVDGLNNCWIKHDMATHFRDNRGPGYVSGRRNTCIGPAPWPLMSCGSKKKCEYETPPCPGTNDYGQDYDVEIIPDIKLPPLPQAQPGSNGPCIGLNNATGNATASRKGLDKATGSDAVSRTACLKEKNTQYRGIKIQHQSGIDGSEEKCAHLCAGVSLCKFWSYRKRGKYCVIKSSISGRKFKKNWTSGPNKSSCVKGDPEFSSRPPPPPPAKGDPKFSSRPPPPPPAKGAPAGPADPASALSAPVAPSIPAGPSEPSGCFPGTSMVMLDGGRKRSMEELRIGDIVMTVENGSLEPTSILGFLDKKVNQTAYYINLILEDNRSLFISSRHVMFIRGDNGVIQSILAKYVSLGDMVIVDDDKKVGFVRISNINVELKMGAYVPLTHAGTLLVDGVLVSSYTNADHWLAHITLSPLRWWPTLLLDTERSQTLEGLRIFPHLMRNLGGILGLVTMADGKVGTIENPVLEMSQLVMENINKTEF